MGGQLCTIDSDEQAKALGGLQGVRPQNAASSVMCGCGGAVDACVADATPATTAAGAMVSNRVGAEIRVLMSSDSLFEWSPERRRVHACLQRDEEEEEEACELSSSEWATFVSEISCDGSRLQALVELPYYTLRVANEALVAEDCQVERQLWYKSQQAPQGFVVIRVRYGSRWIDNGPERYGDVAEIHVRQCRTYTAIGSVRSCGGFQVPLYGNNRVSGVGEGWRPTDGATTEGQQTSRVLLDNAAETTKAWAQSVVPWPAGWYKPDRAVMPQGDDAATKLPVSKPKLLGGRTLKP